MTLKKTQKKLHKLIRNHPIFILNYKPIDNAKVVGSYEDCFEVEINKKTYWFKMEDILPMDLCFKCLYDTEGFYINRRQYSFKGLK